MSDESFDAADTTAQASGEEPEPMDDDEEQHEQPSGDDDDGGDDMEDDDNSDDGEAEDEDASRGGDGANVAGPMSEDGDGSEGDGSGGEGDGEGEGEGEGLAENDANANDDDDDDDDDDNDGDDVDDDGDENTAGAHATERQQEGGGEEDDDVEEAEEAEAAEDNQDGDEHEEEEVEEEDEGEEGEQGDEEQGDEEGEEAEEADADESAAAATADGGEDVGDEAPSNAADMEEHEDQEEEEGGGEGEGTVRYQTAKNGNAVEEGDEEDEEEDSDVELEGIDMEGLDDEAEGDDDTSAGVDEEAGQDETLDDDEEEGDEEEEEEEEPVDDDSSMPPPLKSKGKAKVGGKGKGDGGAEDHSFDEVVSEHSKNLQELRERQEADETDAGNSAERRLQYLMQQSEVFTHFLDSTNFGAAQKAKAGKKADGVRGRMKEQEEDKILLATAASKARVTRLSKQPSLIKFGTMRAYQLEGLNWMIKLHDNGINGILADEMGLGKTLQSISVLAYLREDRGINGPHIVIVPKSTVGNWMREFKRWCPAIRTVKLLGNKAERKIVCEGPLTTGKFDACVASYESVLKEAATLKKIKWRYLLIDEAHRIKNENSSLSKTVRLLSTQFRLLITGTPLQNNLHELWALLNFLLPDVFSSADTFDQWFNLQTDKSARDNVIKKLHTILRPFMLRRIKADVEKDLPPKKEVKLYIGMTPMQRKWYKDLLNRDVGNLNTLGGPDKMRLLNILMQLRKVCNHPYLFDGAEPGPPFVNGSHLWENAGKMVLLQKLLPKLRTQGSRVLLFCQMTRLLDILEDYMHLQGYDYCRIDGGTDGESRDSQMDEFNEPGSSKFLFLLSTRAGGLGINLATADVVILYDSDWNPQVDLQAMDRAHRIGQTKPVKVFRFITEGTVEEKIVERADRKLFLDAAVIQQGRLAEKNASLDKRELMAMVKFGADEILRMDDSQGLTDESIDELLKKGEERTEETHQRIQKDMQHNLLTFKIDEEEGMSTFLFDGKDHSGTAGGAGTGAFINLPTRQRKSNYDVNEYYRARMQDKNIPGVRKRKGITMHDFQFFDREALEALQTKEHDFADKKNAIIAEIKELRNKSKRMDVMEENDQEQKLEESLNQLELTPKEQADKKRMIEAAFGDWNRKDFRAFVAATERHGRDDTEAVLRDVCLETAKTEENVRKYIKVFWKRCRELTDYAKIMEKIEKGEKRIFRSKQIRTAIDKKVSRHANPWQDLTINYYGGKGKVFTEEEDAFLLNMMHRYGYGNWEVIRMEIRKAWQFRFDWFFKSRNAAELQRRGDTLIRLVEKENEELEAALSGGKKRKSGGGDTPANKKKRGATPSASAKKKGRSR